MGLLDNFKKNKHEQESQLINWLYSRADQLSGTQLTELLRYALVIFGDPALGMFLIRLLIKKINTHIDCQFEPRTKEDFNKWLDDFFAKTSLETQRAIFVTAVFDVYQHNVTSASAIMHKIDETLEKLKQTPEFEKLK